jgi:hypothetical protein
MTPVPPALAKSFEVDVVGMVLVARRRRTLPSRGIFRLLVPRVVARIDGASVRVQPDVLAWFMLVVCAGGMLVEVTMDRVKYPREYPPWFVFALSAFYVANLALERRRTSAAAAEALRAR